MKVFLFISLLLLPESICMAEDILEETCRKATSTTGNYNFCLTSLQTVPESRSGDTKSIAVIATNLTVTNYTHNLAKISELLSRRDQVKQALGTCLAAYNVGVSDLKMSADQIRSSDIDEALVNLSEAWKRPRECEDAFSERKEKSILRQENDFASRLITLALKITVLLKM